MMARPGHSLSRQEVIHRIWHRLTDRDRDLVRLLGEHRVLTGTQIAAAFFPTPARARVRLKDLHDMDVLGRFRPHRATGSHPYHYQLAYTGACILAAATERPWPRPIDVAEQAARATASPRLAHDLRVADTLTALLGHARVHGYSVTWQGEASASVHAGGLVRPDALISINGGDGFRVFFYEQDTGTENLGTLTAKLRRYAHVPDRVPVLIELHSLVREQHLRQALAAVELPYPLLTTHTDLAHQPGTSLAWPLHGLTRIALTSLPPLSGRLADEEG